jgi:hypothetical protein
MTTPLLPLSPFLAQERAALRRTQARFEEVLAMSDPGYLHQEFGGLGPEEISEKPH